ncbi:MAG: Phosphoribosyl-ATP pyrophosphohydrolase [Sporanaerobacter sp.]|uniref:phosphoribosyl-ATP pyrophosphohydrolase n=1 Tax=Sporanaerobacter sp. TaxID=2010183 RepID=UPI003A0FED11
MEKVYNKLVRDNIPEIIEKDGKKSVIEIMDENEFLEELNKKLIEETEEYIEDENIEEIADILEVIHGILKAKGTSFEEVEKIRLEKRHKRGGFEGKIKLVKVIE